MRKKAHSFTRGMYARTRTRAYAYATHNTHMHIHNTRAPHARHIHAHIMRRHACKRTLTRAYTDIHTHAPTLGSSWNGSRRGKGDFGEVLINVAYA